MKEQAIFMELIAEGKEEGIEQGQNTLVDTVNRLRNGETAENIIASGIDKRTVELAKSIK